MRERRALVSLAFLYTGSLEDAQELTQEAFARAWERWAHVSKHPNKDAWIRTVVYNLAASRWRRVRSSAERPAGQPTDVPPLSADHLDIARLISALPPRQKRAFVLQVVLDMPAEQVAEEMRARPATVRSWVLRARQKLASEIAGQAETAAKRGSP